MLSPLLGGRANSLAHYTSLFAAGLQRPVQHHCEHQFARILVASRLGYRQHAPRIAVVIKCRSPADIVKPSRFAVSPADTKGRTTNLLDPRRRRLFCAAPRSCRSGC